MPNLKMMALSLACCAAFLTACQSSTVTKLAQIPPSPAPVALTTCQDGPERPPLEATQKAVALILVDFQEALADCKRKLAALVQAWPR